MQNVQKQPWGSHRMQPPRHHAHDPVVEAFLQLNGAVIRMDGIQRGLKANGTETDAKAADAITSP